MRMVFSVTPVAKPRQSQADKWQVRPPVARYRTYADELRRQARRAGFRMPEAGAAIRFTLPMPRSWSKRKRAALAGQPHRQKPDLDNLIKALTDALLPDDSGLWQLAGAEKRWGEAGSIEITIAEG